MSVRIIDLERINKYLIEIPNRIITVGFLCQSGRQRFNSEWAIVPTSAFLCFYLNSSSFPDIELCDFLSCPDTIFLVLTQVHRGVPAHGGQQPHLRGHGHVQVFRGLPRSLQRLVCSGSGHRSRHRSHIFCRHWIHFFTFEPRVNYTMCRESYLLKYWWRVYWESTSRCSSWFTVVKYIKRRKPVILNNRLSQFI